MSQVHWTAAIALAGALVTGSALAQPKVDWPTYAFDSLRSGANPAETLLGAGTVSQLAAAWQFNPANADLALNPLANPANARVGGQPVLAAGVMVNGQAVDLLLFGDNNGFFYALDANSTSKSGTIVWSAALGTASGPACGGNTSIFGVRAAAAIDRTANNGNGAVYVAVHGSIHALDLTTGMELAGWPVTMPGPAPSATDGWVHDAPNVVGGKLYVGTSSGTCDTPPYYGRVAVVDTASATATNMFFPLSGNAGIPKYSGGGVWGAGGVAVDPGAAVGGIYAASGNARTGAGQQRPYAEYILNLSPDLSTLAGAAAPTLPAGDNDFGSTPVVFQLAGCSGKLLAAVNKTGLLVVETIGADGTLAVTQSLQIMTMTAAAELVGNVAWDAADQLLFVTAKGDGPAPFSHGLSAFSVASGCAPAPLTLAWQTTTGSSGVVLTANNTALVSPTVANGLVWYGSGNPKPSLVAVAVAAAASGSISAGQVAWQTALPGCAPTAPPTVVNGRVFVACVGASKSFVLAYALPGS